MEIRYLLIIHQCIFVMLILRQQVILISVGGLLLGEL